MAREKEEPRASADPEGEAFTSLAAEGSVQPEPIKPGEYTSSKVEDHKHNYQSFNVGGKHEELCVVCTRKKGSRG